MEIEGNEQKEMMDFLDYAGNKGFIAPRTAKALKTGLSKVFDMLEDGQRNARYVLANLDTIKGRFLRISNGTEMTAATAEEYLRRARQTAQDYLAWVEDRSGWERRAATKGVTATRGTPAASARAKSSTRSSEVLRDDDAQPEARVLHVPLADGTDAEIRIPRDLITKEDHLRIGIALLPYCQQFSDFTPDGMRWPLPIDAK